MPESRLNATGDADLAEETAGRWPTQRTWRVFYLLGVGLMAEWIVVYGGANWITELHSYRVALQTRFDSALPFIPAAATIYLSLFPMLWLSPFFLRSAARLRAFARSLAIVILISGIGFLVVPAEPIAAVSTGTGPSKRIFQFADWLNLTHNYFPSLHVGMATVCAVFYSRSASAKVAAVYCVWAGMIAMSTLLTRQHYVADMLAGGALGAIVATRYRPMVESCVGRSGSTAAGF